MKKILSNKRILLISLAISYFATIIGGLADRSLYYLYLAWVIWLLAILIAISDLSKRWKNKISITIPLFIVLFVIFWQYWFTLQIWAGQSEKYAGTLLGLYFSFITKVFKVIFG